MNLEHIILNEALIAFFNDVSNHEISLLPYGTPNTDL